jgi:hypothetical protein
MKKSGRLLAWACIYCIFVSVSVIAAGRFLYGFNATQSPPGSPAVSESAGDANLSRTMPAGKRIPWYAITFGLRRTGFFKADVNRSIFMDIPLTVQSCSHDHSLYLFPTGGSGSSEDRVTILNLLPDLRDSGHRNDFPVPISVWLSHDNRNTTPANSWVTIHSDGKGFSRYWYQNSAVCEWRSGKWLTMIRVPLAVLEGDSVQAVDLREKIRERILSYYAAL